MSDEKRETVSDIVAQMRGCGEDGRMDMSLWRQYADRIDEAWKREKAEIEADALAVGGIVEAARRREATAEKSSAVGNAAAMREAILAIKDINDRRPHDADGYEINDIINAALSAPARNCDRFNTGDPMKDAEDAYDAWQRYCDDPTIPPSCKIESAFKQWLFAPAAERKGENDGR